MCRLFGLTADSARVQATFWLLDAPHSILVQSRSNPDGTGLGTFGDDGTPRIEKRALAAFEDFDFAHQARQRRSSTFVAHVRHATTGELTAENTHPFALDGRIFAHNGMVGDVGLLEDHLGADLGMVRGDTDSERFFALITREIRRAGDVGPGIAAAVDWVADHLPVRSLNFVLASPTELWALRYPEPDTLYLLERQASDPPLDQTSSAGMRIAERPPAGHAAVVVASEKLDADERWRTVEPGTLVHVGPSLEVDWLHVRSRPPRRLIPRDQIRYRGR